MPHLFIRTCNSSFASLDEGAHYDRSEDALKSALRSAVSIAADEIHDGEATAAVDISVEDASGKSVHRSVVAISVSSLIPDPSALALTPGDSWEAAND